MLGFDNIPIVVLSEVNSSAPQWKGQDLARAQWKEGKVVALIEWIKGLDEERWVKVIYRSEVKVIVNIGQSLVIHQCIGQGHV